METNWILPFRLYLRLLLSWKVPAFRSARPFGRERPGAGSRGTWSGVSCSELPAFLLARAWPSEFSLLTYFSPLSRLYSNVSIFRAGSSGLVPASKQLPHLTCALYPYEPQNGVEGGWARNGPAHCPWPFPAVLVPRAHGCRLHLKSTWLEPGTPHRQGTCGETQDDVPHKARSPTSRSSSLSVPPSALCRVRFEKPGRRMRWDYCVWQPGPPFHTRMRSKS